MKIEAAILTFFFSLVASLGADIETGRKHATIFWITPRSIFQTNDKQAYLYNVLNFEFMTQTGAKIPIPLNEAQANHHTLNMISICRQSLNTNFKPYGVQAHINGSLTNIGSVRALEGATDLEAYNRPFKINTVVETTILNTGLALPPESMEI